MVVLRAIGRFFAKIGRWIRDTAWVQPLLIVGGIFAIIFSIPYITKWVGSWFTDNSVAYVKFYSKYQLSVDGCDKKESKADGLLTYLEHIKDGSATDKEKKQYGEKFFIAFVQEGCSGCESNYGGFEYLSKNYTIKNSDSQFYLGDNAFKIHSIFCDETDSDIEYDGNIFDHYIFENHLQIFETACEKATDEYNYNYLVNKGGKGSDYYKSAEKLADEIQTPTVFLIDATTPEYAADYGIREILFSYEAKSDTATKNTNEYSRALTLVDAWNGTGIFSEEYTK